MKKAAHILIVEDIPPDAELAERAIRKVLKGCAFQLVETRKDFLKALETFQPDVILANYALPRFDGITALKLARKHAPLTPLIIWTGASSEDIAVDCLKAGANNYVLKENIKRLGPAVLRALEERESLVARQRAEAELLASEIRFRAFVDHASDSFFLHDESGIILDVNHRACESLGYTREELIGMTPFDFDVNVTPTFIKQIGAQLRAGEVATFDTRHRRKDGSLFPVEVRLRRFQENGRGLAVSLVREITERKKAEEELQSNEKRFRALIENGLDDISLVAADGTLLWESPSTIRNLGYAPGEFLTRNIFEIMHPEDLVWTRNVFDQLIQEPGGRENGIFRLRRSDGTWRWVEAIATNFLNEPGINAVVINYRDITERKQVEEALREERNLLRTLIDNIPDRIYAMDSQGRKTLSNTADWQACGGKTMEEVIGKTDFDTYPPDLAQEFWQLNKVVLESGQAVINHEEPGLDAEGNPVWILTTKIPLRNSKGNVTGLVGIGRDITERKQAEEHINDLLAFNERMLNHSAVGILTYKVSGQCVFANEKAASIVGTTVAQLLTQNFQTIKSWKSSGLYDLVEKAITSLSPTTEDIHHISTFGKEVWMTAHCITFKVKGEDHVLLSISDITERKQMEEKLRQSENRYRLAVKATNDVIWETNLQVKQLFWSENAQIVFGYTPEEVDSYETWWDDHLHPDDRERLLSKMNSLIEGDESLWMDEYRFQLKNGSYVYISDRGYIERDKNGRPLRMIGAMTDITERKQAEAKLREGENRLFMALSGAQMSVWEWDLKTNQIFWSPEFFKITGVNEDQFGGTFHSFTDLIHHDDMERVRSAAEKAMREQTLFAEEFRIICPDGEVRWLSNLGQAEYDSTGSYLRLIGTVQDVTQRKQAEMERQVLLEIMQGFANTEDLHELLELIHHSVARVVYAKNFFIVLYQPETGLFEEIYTMDQYDPPAPPDKLEKSITSYVFRTGEPLLLTQVLFDELVQRGEIKLVGTDSASWLGVPLKTSGRTIGVMVVQDYEYVNRYSERDKDFLVSIAAQVALAIERKQAEIELQQKNDDLGLLNAINDAVVRGQNLNSIIELLSKDLSRIFSVQGNTIYSTIYMLAPDKQSISMQKYFFSSDTKSRIENLIGFSIPRIEIPLREGDHFHRAMVSGRSAIMAEPDEIKNWIAEFAENSFLHLFAGTAVRKLIPQIQKVLNIQSLITVPLIYEAEIIGFWEVSSSGLLTASDQKRIEHIGGQLTAVIQRQQANEKIRRSEEFLRGVQNALSASIAILDESGTIVRVNSAWREFGKQNDLQHPNAGIGLNYLEICDSATGFNAEGAASVAQAIRTILGGQSSEARVEYPCHSPDIHRWFTLHITKFEDGDQTWVVLAHEDITERKRAEEALRESEEHYRAIFEGVQDAIFVESLDGKILTVNQQACEMFGYSYEEFLSKTAQDLVPEGHLILMADGAHLSPEPHETLNRRANGEIFPIDISVRLQVIDGETVLLVVIRDITERKKAENLLQESENRFSSAFEYASIGMALVSPEGRWLRVNWALCELVGYTEEELVQKTFQDITYQDDLEKDAGCVRQLLAGEIDSYEMEKRYIHKSGKLIWVLLSVSLVRDPEGKPLYFIAQIQDITERKQAVESLRAEREKMQNYLDIAGVIMLALDQEGTVTLINQKGCEILGYPADEIIGKNWMNTFLPESIREELQRVFQELISGSSQAAEYYENAVLTNHGEKRLIAWHNTSVRDGQGRIINMLSSGEDITERNQAESEIRRRAEENSILLKTSLALTSLDLKTTLQTVGDSAKNLFAADGCRIFLMEPDGKSLRCVLALQEDLDAFSELRIKIGEGVTGTVAASGQAEIVNEMQNDPRSVQVLGTAEEEEAIMFAPLKERGDTVGVLSIRRTGRERPFQPADLTLLEALASIAASAVSNARLFAETQRRLSELEALHENGLAVGRLLKPNQIGNRLIHTFSSYLPWHHVTIRLRRDASDDLELVAFSLPNLKEEERTNAEQHFIARINKVGQGLSGWVIQTGAPLRTGNVREYPQYIDTHSRIQSGLYLPLKVGDRVIGVISVESELPDAFTEQDERLLATLASQAAIAFENARLYQEIEQELLERKRAEEALRTSETHYRELADSITDILFELDHELRYTHWNKASEMFSGICAADAIGRSLRDLFGTSEEQSRREEIYKSVLNERQARSFETEVMAKGEKRALEINAYPSARGLSVVAKDVTDRKRSEIIMQKRFELMEYSAHHSLEELMRRTVDEVSELTGSTVGFFHFVQEDQNLVGMQTWSTNTLKLYSVPVSEGAHLPLDQAGVWADVVHQRRPLIQNDYEALAHQEGWTQGHVPIRREIIIPIIRNEKVMAVMGIGNKPQEYTSYDLEVAARLADYAWDITERKQMQVALEMERNQLAKRVEERTSDLSRANSNLARALRVKDEFLANMSHELRTPLNAILGLSESLGEQIAGPLNEKQQKYITTISESGHHLLSLINDILDLAKIEAGQITLDINKVNIHQVCQASLRMIKQLAQKKNQDVVLEMGDGLEVMWVDERRLKQMIVNLLGNAVKFTPEHGKIGLEVHGDQVANKITITVWDNGIGIKEEDLARLFQPFVQLDSGLAREATGTGLGLALVAQMARLHGGSVSAVSEPGKGSRFSIILPWEPGLAMDTSSRLRSTGKFPAIKPDETDKPTVLLVEDTKEVVMMIRDYLELAGYKVVIAQDGVEAIDQARLVHPDLILMDVMMPRMDGFEATRKLRSEAEFKYTPIIALTALAMPSDRERCLTVGMDEYISKPINLKALVRMIQSCLFNSKEPKPG